MKNRYSSSANAQELIRPEQHLVKEQQEYANLRKKILLLPFKLRNYRSFIQRKGWHDKENLSINRFTVTSFRKNQSNKWFLPDFEISINRSTIPLRPWTFHLLCLIKGLQASFWCRGRGWSPFSKKMQDLFPTVGRASDNDALKRCSLLNIEVMLSALHLAAPSGTPRYVWSDDGDTFV